MKIAITSDEIYPVHQIVIDWVKQKGYEPVLFGALKSNQNEHWVKAAREAAQAIQQGLCTEGIFFCWTGTGISMVANKCLGIRAALCTDAETARGARIWNHSNVLALSNRLLSQDIAKEILAAWYDSYDKSKGAEAIVKLKELENIQ